ncbi:MAG: YihY/virulence factor BrkB family protein [Bacteroidota bacterium]
MKIKSLGKKIWYLLKESFSEFINDNVPKLSASLSYFTIFSLPPLLIIIIYLCGIFFGAEAVRGEIFGQINVFVGNDAALQIQEMIKNIKLSNNNGFAATIGIITLLLGASGVFAEIQDSINFIWGLKAKPKKGVIKFLKNRLMSFSMIGSMGFLLLVGLIVNSVMDVMSKRLESFFPHITVSLFYALNITVVFIIITLLFTVIFRTLPDGKVAYKDAIIGASFTAILFMVGKFAIGAYLGSSSVASTYGVAGSLIVILLWVYYSAIILYFGAEFTKVYALAFGKKIIPNNYAVYIKKEDIEVQPKIVAAN